MKEKKIQHIYWFAYYGLSSPSVRYRALFPLQDFNANRDITYDLVLPGYKIKNLLQFFKVYFSILFFRKKNSIIVIQRIQSRFIYAFLLKLLIRIRNDNTIYDLDDADYLDTDPATIYYFAKHCSAIAAGSERIKKHLEAFNRNVFHVTSPVVDLGICKGKRNQKFTIGWIGDFGGEHRRCLEELLFPVLVDIDFPVTLVLMGIKTYEEKTQVLEQFTFSKTISLEIPMDIDWANECSIQQEISRFDVGIATLSNKPIQLSKSGIKAKQYLNNGVPTISSDLKENNRFVRHEKNGFLCTTSEEFLRSIRHLRDMDDSNYELMVTEALNSRVYFNHDYYYHAILEMVD